MLDAAAESQELVDALCDRSPDFRSALTAPAMLASLMVPDTAPIALNLLEKLDIAVGDALSELIIAKDVKGKSYGENCQGYCSNNGL